MSSSGGSISGTSRTTCGASSLGGREHRAACSIISTSPGLAENTVVIYSSDQGFYLGEHGWFDKRWMYEESSLRMPMMPSAGPASLHPGRLRKQRSRHQTSTFAETFLDIAGVRRSRTTCRDASLVPLLNGATPEDWRRLALLPLLRILQRAPLGPHASAGTYGVSRRTGYKLIHFYQHRRVGAVRPPPRPARVEQRLRRRREVGGRCSTQERVGPAETRTRRSTGSCPRRTLTHTTIRS